MRRYNSNKSVSGVSRSKSTKSTCSFRSAIERLEHIDPAIADRDAHLAATLSFSRSSQPLAPGTVASASVSRHPLHRSQTEYSGDTENYYGAETADGKYDENGLRRQKSVRFAKPTQKPDAGVVRRRSVLGRVENQQNSPNQSKAGTAPYVSSYTASYIESLPPVEAYIPTEERSSVSSSRGKLRKSRSMFAPTAQTPDAEYYFSNSPEQENPRPALRRKSLQNIKDAKSPKKHRSLRAPKSMSFLKTGTMNTQPGVRANHHAKGKDVRGKFSKTSANDEGQLHLKSRSSGIFSSNMEGMRHSMRNASTNTLVVPKQSGSLRKKARKVSNGLRTKLKSFFRRSKDDEMEEDEVPTTSNEHGGRGAEAGGDAEDDDAYMEIGDPVADECSISQVPSRVPSLHNASSAQQLRSRQGSIESIDSGRKVSDDKSRVTSWTNSDTYTLNSQVTWNGEKDRQRLSVIKEIGPHVSSSSFRRPALNGTNPFEFEAMSPEKKLERSGAAPAVDSQRVFSALMGRLNEVKEKENLRRQALRQASVDDFGTIRCVQPEDDVFQDSRPEKIPETGIPDTEDENASTTGSVIHRPQRSESGSTLYKAYPAPTAGDEKENEPTVASESTKDVPTAPKALSTRRSAFFGSPTCHLFRTTSPYRRALQKSMQETSEVSTQIRSPTLSTLNLDLVSTRRHPSLSVEDPRVAYSESIYSDQYLSPKGNPPALAKIVTGSLRSRRPSNSSSGKHSRLTYSKSFDSNLPVERDTDTNTISSKRHERSGSYNAPRAPLVYTPTMPTDHTRTASYASSVEWKTYLSANISKADLHAPAAAKGLSEVRYAKPSMPRTGHVREGAQIDDDSPISYKPTGLERPIRYHTPLRTTSHNRQFSSASRAEGGAQAKLSTSSRDENTVPYSDGRVSSRVRGMYGPPPIPPRSSLRTVPSMPLLQTRMSQSNIPIKSPKRKMRSVDNMAEVKPVENQQKPKTRSPMKLVRRAGLRNGIKPSLSSPGLAMTVERQFGPMLLSDQIGRGSPEEKWQNRSDRRLLDPSDSADYSDTTSSEDWRAQKLGSQQMVDNFLSGKRRLHGRSEESRVFL
ncbi:hypothetical protein CkaCkLH20_03056 [Colletotrichum karsti]|uniref:Uncharacterized protein n=1 Tax=Colletotrichum karsti TaxID=1095194 RepID=A0A9P6IAU5_9PEZI|nr:uncharacterized protein CkaCkLH20_03056 [Colletotrichum karsti]KAF9879513.1 hypothetical protein CkaCkLH20_03056 [Colletotrichum karsti]